MNEFEKLNREREQIEERTQELGKKEVELRALEQEVAHEREEFQATLPAEREALEKASEEFQKQKRQMEGAAQMLDEMVRLKRELIAGFDEQILAKQREYENLKALVAS